MHTEDKKEEQKVADLLKPRYKVNTPWPPNNNFQTGDIVLPEQFTGWHPKDYPVIFRKMPWWEEREEKDMPQYVKCVMGSDKDKIFKIAAPEENGRFYHPEGEIEHGYFKKYAGWFLPATLTDYKLFIEQSKK